MQQILTINAGSSSLKFGVFGGDTGAGGELPVLLRGKIDGLGRTPRFSAVDGESRPLPPPDIASAELAHPLETLLQWIETRIGAGSLCAAGHRIAFGGFEFAAPTCISPQVLLRLRALVPFAPLHQPANVEPIEWLAERQPGLSQVACFDSAFHRSAPELARRYGLPEKLHAAGARRYGFHGLSYEYIAGRLATLDPEAAAGRTIVAHVGSGASLCALRGGASVATTMGFSALSGVMMATRPGDLDPGIVIWLLRERGLSLQAVETLLYHESGLKGVGGSADMRMLLSRRDTRARVAVDLFVYRVVREIGSLAAALGGLDALVFTAGVGEHSALIRAAICAGCRWLGVDIDRAANDGPAFGARRAAQIHLRSSRVRLWVIPTDEEQVIARHTLRLALPNRHATRRSA